MYSVMELNDLKQSCQVNSIVVIVDEITEGTGAVESCDFPFGLSATEFEDVETLSEHESGCRVLSNFSIADNVEEMLANCSSAVVSKGI